MIYFAGILLIISAFTHVIQIKYFPEDRLMKPAVVFGFVYLIIGILLLLETRAGLVLGTLLPALGAVGGLYRYFKHQRLKLILFHILIDLIVIIVSLSSLF